MSKNTNKNKGESGVAQIMEGRSPFKTAEVLVTAGRFDEAETLVREVLAQSPSSIEARAVLGKIGLIRGDHGSALGYFDQILAEVPGNPLFKSFRALVLLKLKRHDEARAEAEAVLTDYPNFMPSLKVLAEYWVDKKEFSQAEALLRRVLDINADDGDALGLLGLACIRLDRDDEARIHLKRAIKLNPRRADLFQLVGSTYRNECRFRVACSYMRRGYKLKPDSMEPALNFATLLAEMGEVHEALQVFRRALARHPGVELLRFNMSVLLLLIGQLREGWEAYEARRSQGLFRDSIVPFPTWMGESLKGKTLLILGEQGIGDEILAASMYAEAVGRAGHCFIECEPRLAGLFRRSFPQATVFPRQKDRIDLPADRLPTFKTLAFSMARWMRSSVDDFPGTVGYLVPDPERVRFWRWRISQLGSGLKVGISWRSMMNTGVRRHNYTTLDQWTAIFKVPGVHFVNLQYDRCQEELDEASARSGVKITNFRDIDLKDDIEETAALISALDVVIAPANAVAMLSGALNIPVLEFSDHNNWPCLGTDRFPWFPSFQMFFRPWNGGWEPALNGIANEIARRAHTHARDCSPDTFSGDEVALLQQRISLARLLLLQKKFDKARSACEAILAVRGTYDDALLLLGMVEQAAGNHAGAEAAFRRLTAAAPLFAEAFNGLGIALLSEGRVDEATAEFNRALDLRPEYTDALNNLGNAYVTKREHSKALECYRRAIDAFSGHATARFNYALALEDTGRVEDAIVQYETVLDGNGMHAEAWNNLGNLYGRMGKAESCEAAYRNALLAAPNFASAHINLAKLLLRIGRSPQEAVEHLEKATSLRSEDAGLANMLGVAYLATGAPDKAVVQFERALAIAPGFLDAVRNLASTLQRLGRLEEARDVLVKGLSFHADGRD